MKKVLSLVLVILLFLCAPLGAASTYVDNSIKVLVNGYHANTQIVMNEGSVFVPLRFMSSQLGADVNWDSNSRTVSVKKDAANVVKTYPEPLIINGSDTFKKTISQSLSLLKSKQPSKYLLIEENVKSINEASLNKTPGNMFYTIGVCSFDTDNIAPLSSSDKQIQIAGVLVHEAHHAWLYNQGLFGKKGAVMSGLDSEVLAQSMARQTIKSLGASDKLMSITSVDWVVDHNYQGVN